MSASLFAFFIVNGKCYLSLTISLRQVTEDQNASVLTADGILRSSWFTSSWKYDRIVFISNTMNPTNRNSFRRIINVLYILRRLTS